jgi:hypothetical protein
MRLKPISKRRWKARMMMGRWMPRLVIESRSLTAPEGYKLVWHHTEDFLMMVPLDTEMYSRPIDYHPDQTKRAWE